MRARVLDVLKREAISAATPASSTSAAPELEIELKYFEGEPVIQRDRARFEAGPPRLYASVKDLPRSQRPRHFHLSTPKGVMSDARSARAERGRRGSLQVF
jgi:small subunit ribosomal protein S8